MPSLLQLALAALRDGEIGRLSEGSDWLGWDRAPAGGNWSYLAHALENATEQQHDFYEERDFLEQKGCCVVQEEPDGDSQRKG